MSISYEWRGDFDNGEVNELHAAAFDHPVLNDDWSGQLRAHSLGWVSARNAAALVGFVNVAWDGGVHALVVDTMVAADARRQGIGGELVRRAASRRRTPASYGFRRASYSGQTWRLYSSGARSTAAARPGASHRQRR
jgi:GNAT superfamily N-acetyltransferase